MSEQPFEVPFNPDGIALELEMAYTSWNESCKDFHITADGYLMQCRRRCHHDGPHATGFATSKTLRLWT